jgi:hypothetical protein
MGETQDHIPNEDRNGQWQPPRGKGRNAIAGVGPSFFCDGTRIQPVTQIPTANVTAFQTYSIYYNQGGFWILNYDATAHQVGDGLDNDSLSNDGRRTSDTRDDTNWSSWRMLSFEHPEGTTISNVCYGGDKTRLRSQSQSQRWVYVMFPTTYHSVNTTGQGGLNGELPIILGLLAFSIDHRQIAWMFQNCFQNGSWTRNLHSGNHGSKFYVPWLRILLLTSIGVDRRGMVVRVYSYPPYSSNEYLVAYERGQYGTIFS